MQKEKVKKRKYILASATCSEAEYDNIHSEDKYKTSQAAIKFFRVFCLGLVRCNKKIIAYTARPTTLRKCGKKILDAKTETVDGIEYYYAKSVHIKILKHIHCALSAFCWFMSKKCSKEDIVVYDPLNVSLSIGVVLACKLRRIKCVSFITDIPVCYAFNKNGKPSFSQRVSQYLCNVGDVYVFLTEQMNDIVNTKNKPYTVIEGFVDENLSGEVSVSQKYQNPVITYTGGIEKIYGLDMLVEGFIKAEIPDSELHLYGAGSYVKEIKELAEKYPQIRYFGCKNNREVVVEQAKSSLLVNPRYSGAEYTKYSFPSKNLEYMVSGTPMLTTALPGIPKEYYDYIFILEDETVDGMAKKLKEIFSLSSAQLVEKGTVAKRWTVANKNNCTQVKKFVDFVDMK